MIPAALGRFLGEFVFRALCRACNGAIGSHEEQLLRCAPEAFFRRLVNPIVKRSSRGANWKGAGGVPPPRFTVKHETHEEIVDPRPDDPSQVDPVAQLVVLYADGGQREIRLHPAITETSLRSRVQELGTEQPKKLYLYAYQSEWPHYFELVRRIWPESSLDGQSSLDAGKHQVWGGATFAFAVAYWRAIAKVGFHYYLVNNRRGYTGHEPEFAAIRAFVMGQSGDPSDFFAPQSRIVTAINGVVSYGHIVPGEWVHFLAADESDGFVTAMVSLFMGPERFAPTYQLRLSQSPLRLVVPNARHAHSYRYFDDQRAGPYAGRVVREYLQRLR